MLPSSHLCRSSRLIIVCLALVPLLYGCGKGQEQEKEFHETRVLMGTNVSITAFADSGTGTHALDDAFAEIARVDRLMSSYREDSELSKINRQAAHAPVTVSAETFTVISRATYFSKISAGAFDITIAPLSTLWRDAKKSGAVPLPEEIARALKFVGYRNVSLDEETRSVSFKKDGVAINLGAIAKGYAIDRAARALEARGIGHGLVDAGGDLYALGTRPDGSSWRAGVLDPRVSRQDAQIVTVLEIANRAVATSGNYQRYFEVAGKRYSHIIDPRSGQPADAIPSVTVIAPDATTADAIATAVSVLGLLEGMKLIESIPEVEALLITLEGSKLKQHPSSGLASYISE